MSDTEKFFMSRAIRLAKLNAGKTAPNPWVGAILVKDGKIIGEGFHVGAGFPHAEVEAIRTARKMGYSTEGSHMYVSLQPCNTYGRTPPCVDIIRDAGIRKVFFSIRDPNVDQRKYGPFPFEVRGGVLEEEGRRVLIPYLTYVEKKRPYLIIKLAQTLDGRIADFTGESKYISSEKSIRLVHALRARSNVILVGSRTVEMDNPFLNTRMLPRSFLRRIKDVKGKVGGNYPDPVKVVVDSDLSLFLREDLNLRLGNNTVFICDVTKSRDVLSVVLRKGVHLTGNFSFFLVKAGSARISPFEILDFLYDIGAIVVLIEGGGITAWQFIKDGIFDEIWLFLSPKILGGGASLGGEEPMKLKSARNLRISSVRRVGTDLLLILSEGSTWDLF